MRLVDYDKLQLKLRNYADKKADNGEIEIANGILKAKCFIDQECEIINKKQLNGGWIPVTERLPERDSNCLVTTENGEIFTSKFYGYGEECQGFKEFPEGVWEIDAYGEIVIAWQPLPPAWKGENNG